MIKIYIDEEDLLQMLTDRVLHWTDDDTVIELYEEMYERSVYDGGFEGAEVNIMQIVDNDYVNYCDVLWPPEEDETGHDAKRYRKALEIYKEQGTGDCSEYDLDYSYIEAMVEDCDGNPVFLVRI
jgi:hypothetical protein